MYIIYYTDSCLLYTILICWLLQAESSAETFATAVIHGHCATISHSASHWSTLVSLRHLQFTLIKITSDLCRYTIRLLVCRFAGSVCTLCSVYLDLVKLLTAIVCLVFHSLSAFTWNMLLLLLFHSWFPVTESAPELCRTLIPLLFDGSVRPSSTTQISNCLNQVIGHVKVSIKFTL